MTLKKTLVLFLVLALMSAVYSVAWAQNSNPSNLTSSPYTRYGFGKLGSVGNANTRGMGDCGIATRTNRYTNLFNPASLTAIDTLTMLFDTALDAEWFTMSENGATEQSWNAGFAYLTMHFPLWNRFAGSIAYTPYSMVGYEYGNSTKDPIGNALVNNDTLMYSNTYGGTGGLQHFQIAMGWNPIKTRTTALNLGFKAGYICGTINHSGAMTVSSSQSNSTYVSRGFTCTGWDLLLGAQYTQLLAPEKSLIFGVTFAPRTCINSDADVVKQSGKDTIGEDLTMRSKLSAPMKMGFGVSYLADRQLMLTAEYTFENWAKVAGLDANMLKSDNVYQDVHRFAAGVEYRPSLTSQSYFKHCLYRAGVSVRNSYVNAFDSQSEYTATCGISLPMRRSSFNMSASFTHLKPGDKSMIKENYLHLTLGITFNEMMFYRNKLR